MSDDSNIKIVYTCERTKSKWAPFVSDALKELSSSHLGVLSLGEDLPVGDFKFWLKRALSKPAARMSSYLLKEDKLIGRDTYWCRDGVDQDEDFLLPVTPKGKNPVLFLDRDGVINQDSGYVSKLDDLSFVEGIEKVIAFANELLIKVVVLTNQSGVGRGYYKEKDVLDLHEHMTHLLAEKGAIVDAWFFSPYHPESTEARYKRASYTRKPGAGMALEAAAKLDLDLSRAIMVGDKRSDVLQDLDMETILIQGNYDLEGYPDVVSDHKALLIELRKRLPLLK